MQLRPPVTMREWAGFYGTMHANVEHGARRMLIVNGAGSGPSRLTAY